MQTEPCTQASSGSHTNAAELHLPPRPPPAPHRPPAACLQAHPPAPTPRTDALTHGRSEHSRSPQARNESHGSSPDRPLFPDTPGSRPLDTKPHPPYGTSASPLHHMDSH